MATILAFEDNELTAFEKQVVLLENLFLDKPPLSEETVERAQWFLNGGKESKDGEGGLSLFSFTKDADFIFAAFRQTHGIDLQTEEMHWWKFLALFMDMGSETTFCNLVALRKRVKTGKASKEERAIAREIGDLFDVPEIDDLTLEEREREAEFLAFVEEARGK